MKKLVCELCEGTEFTKEGGFFVCHGCGTRYSPEEAKGLMKEVESDGASAGSAPASAPSANAGQQLENILVLATTAYDAQNYAEAENYCNKAIEIDAACCKAWLIKGKAVGWQSKIGSLRIEEAAHFFCKAIDCASEEEKQSVKDQIRDEIKKLGLALISLRKQRFGGSPDDQELKGFRSDRVTILESVILVLKHGVVIEVDDYTEEIAVMMNNAAVDGLNMARKAWRGVDHPNDKDLTTYLNWNGNICALLRDAIESGKSDGETIIKRYENLNVALEDPIGKQSKKQEWNSLLSKYVWIPSHSLADSAVASRREEIAQNRTKIAKIREKVRKDAEAAARKAEEEKQARIAAYWEAHAEEKAKLEEEKKQLSEKAASLQEKIKEIDTEMSRIKDGGKVAVPSEMETTKRREKIKELEDKRSKLGLFAGKEKKQIGEEIAQLSSEIDALKDKIHEEKNARQAEINRSIAPLQARKNDLAAERSKLQERMKEIEEALTRDRDV